MEFARSDRRETRETKVGVLDKVMAVLHAFPRGDVRLDPQSVAARTGLSLPTAYRLMQAMREHGLLEKDAEGYRLGIALLHLGGRVADGMELRREALPHLKWLNERTGENAELHVLRQDARIPIEVVRSAANLRPFAEVGAPLPVHVGASGRVLLAWLPPDEGVALAASSAARFGAGEPADADAVREKLRETRRMGWADSDGERSPGVASVAAPIFDAAGQGVGAVVLSGPSVRLTAGERVRCAPLVREAAARASRDLGYVEESARREELV